MHEGLYLVQLSVYEWSLRFMLPLSHAGNKGWLDYLLHEDYLGGQVAPE